MPSRISAGAAVVAAILVWTTAPAMGVLPPQLYAQARVDAAHHVQVSVSRMTPPRETPGVCRVQGRVVTVFRSRGGVLSPGAPVSFGVDCLAPGDDPGVGGTLWQGVESLKNARFIEAYLNGDVPPGLSVARWQYSIITAPTAEPVCPEDKPGLTCW